MLERDVEKYLIKRVRAVGGHVRKVQWVARRGAPDRLIFGRNLVPCFVELKRPKGGVVSKQQAEEIALLTEGGLSVFIVSDLHEVDALMAWAVKQ